MTIAIPLVLLVVGTLLAAGFGIYLKRPTLRAVGSGGGGGQQFHSCRVQIRNVPGLFGIRLGETVLFGRILHRPIDKGLPIDRNPAKDCAAWIYDGEQALTTLWWQSRNTRDAWQQRTTLESGDAAELVLFARLHDEPTQYFIFAPSDPTDPNMNPRVPDAGEKFQATITPREFAVHLVGMDGRRYHVFPVRVRLQSGLMYVESGGGAGSF